MIDKERKPSSETYDRAAIKSFLDLNGGASVCRRTQSRSECCHRETYSDERLANKWPFLRVLWVSIEPGDDKWISSSPLTRVLVRNDGSGTVALIENQA
jgi:hypothetical protein